MKKNLKRILTLLNFGDIISALFKYGEKFMEKRNQKYNEMWKPIIERRRIPENMQMCVQLSLNDWANLIEDVLDIDDVKSLLKNGEAELNLSIDKKKKKFVMFATSLKAQSGNEMTNDILINFTDYSIRTKNLSIEKRNGLYRKYCMLLSEKAAATPSHLKSMESKFYNRERALMDNHKYIISRLYKTTSEELKLCDYYSLLYRNKAERARREARLLKSQEPALNK